MNARRPAWGLLRRRECLVPTWRGWALLLLGFLAVSAFTVRDASDFLAPTDSKPGGVLVIEGWAPDYALKAAMAEFKAHHYQKLYVTGVPIEYGAPLSRYRSYAQVGAVTLVKFGMNSNQVQAVPAPFVRRDRTYDSALALRRWFQAHRLSPGNVNLMTEGAHARRSWLLFQKALGSRVNVGIIAVPPKDYDPNRWWCCSQGVRTVIGEALAYIYARFFFWPRPAA